MAATFSTVTAMTLADMSRRYMSEDKKLATQINQLKKDDPILEHALWIATNNIDTHKVNIVSELPTTTWRRLYQGIPYDKGRTTRVAEPTRQIARRFAIDVDEMALYEGEADQNAFRKQEGELHIESMQNFVAQQMFYGDSDSDSDEVRGLAARFPYEDGPNTVDGGGSTSTCTSIFAVVWGPKAFFGIYPKKFKAGLRYRDLGVFDAEDASGYKYPAIGDEWKWDIGFCLADWRMASRICNINVPYLTIKHGSANFVDLGDMTVDAKNMIPARKRGNIKWYCSQSVMNALEKQARDPGMVHLRYGQWQDSKEVLMLHGKPVFQCDSILETETALTAMP